MDSIWNNQKFQLNANSHPNKELQKDWNNLGENSFYYEVVDTINLKCFDATKDYRPEVNELLEVYLDELQPYEDNGYNKKPIKTKKIMQ
ncbi:MAG: GIY-YIG nuclease family protein [Bacteroidetes bacterium]|nr:GIY-YIG nuclease family protein [Bacteroidota bacterium]